MALVLADAASTDLLAALNVLQVLGLAAIAAWQAKAAKAVREQNGHLAQIAKQTAREAMHAELLKENRGSEATSSLRPIGPLDSGDRDRD